VPLYVHPVQLNRKKNVQQSALDFRSALATAETWHLKKAVCWGLMPNKTLITSEYINRLPHTNSYS